MTLQPRQEPEKGIKVFADDDANALTIQPVASSGSVFEVKCDVKLDVAVPGTDTTADRLANPIASFNISDVGAEIFNLTQTMDTVRDNLVVGNSDRVQAITDTSNSRVQSIVNLQITADYADEDISAAILTSLENISKENVDRQNDMEDKRGIIDAALAAQRQTNSNAESMAESRTYAESSRAVGIENSLSAAISTAALDAQDEYDLRKAAGNANNELNVLSTAWYNSTSALSDEVGYYESRVTYNDEEISKAQSTAKDEVEERISTVQDALASEISRAQHKESDLSTALDLVTQSRAEDYKNQSTAIHNDSVSCTEELSIAASRVDEIINGDSTAQLPVQNLQSLLNLFTQSEVNMLNAIEESNTEMYQVVRTMNEAYGNVYWYEPDNQVLRYQSGDSRIVNGDDVVYVRHARFASDFDGTGQFKTTTTASIDNLAVNGVERKMIDEPPADEPEPILVALPMTIAASVNGSPGM